jgi:6-phosphogluconolactonase
MRRIRHVILTLALGLGTLAVATGSALAADGASTGAVYTLTNLPAGNAVAVFDRAADGSLTPSGTVPTGGNGTGAGLGSQGALVRDGRRLFAVNAGSNTISALRLGSDHQPALTDIAPSGGVMPISLTVHRHFLYVLNAGGGATAANIAGFFVWRGQLFPLPGSSRPLSTAAPGPAQIEFTPDGRQLVVTEKATNRIVTYRVGLFGYASGPNPQPSAGQTPFGFEFDNRGRLIVSEAFGGAPDASAVSSYNVGSNSLISVLDASVPTTETAACWVVITQNGRYAYTTNTGSASVSGYAIGQDGSLSLLDADGRTGLTGAGPIDAALSRGSRFLYTLDSGAQQISAFAVNADGSLDGLGALGGLPAAAVGLAAV